MTGFARQAAAIARRDLQRERRVGEVAWVTVPFAAVALLLVPLAIGTDQPTLERIGPGLFWAVVLLFGVLIAVRRSAVETPAQRDLTALLGIDPAAGFAGQALASGLLLLGFELSVGAVAVALYNIDLARWPWMIVVLPCAAAGLALLGTLATSITHSLNTGPALVPLLVAPLAVPLLLAATQALDSLRPGDSILPWVLLMVAAVLALAIAGVLAARPLQETR
jgi:heme exporter protein B